VLVTGWQQVSPGQGMSTVQDVSLGTPGIRSEDILCQRLRLSQSKAEVGVVKPDFSVDKVLCSIGSVGVHLFADRLIVSHQASKAAAH